MATSAGTRFGPYEIVSRIGSGGMGEVYKARDARLNRFVALKISAENFTHRFQREAQAIAALNHPHICQLYDVGADYLVMELVEGVPLKGPMALEQALKLAIQLASAIEAAHRKNITHRDLKPANILHTKSGIKVLDFGLAKIGHAKASGTADETVTKGITQEGSVVGTLQYMAPEQLRGEEVDSRADLFAFGCVLYEMLTGKRAFDGANAASVIGSILERDVPSLAGIVPDALARATKKCLAKDPDERWQTAKDLKDELEWIAECRPEMETPRKRHVPTPLALLAAVTTVVLIALAALASLHFREAPTQASLVRFTVAPPANGRLNLGTRGVVNSFISPDGKRIAFSAAGSDGKVQIWLRSLDSVGTQPLAGTEDGTVGCWSPNGRSIAFFAGGKLKRIDFAAGGTSITLADAPDQRGCAWNQDGVILFAPNSRGPLYSVSSAGGSVVPVTALDTKAGDTSHRFPTFLPDGSDFLYASWKSAFRVTICGASLRSPRESRTLQEADSFGLYAEGYMLFLRGSTLMARPFDVKRLTFTGDAVSIAEQVQVSQITAGLAAFSASTNGWLVYGGGTASDDLRLTWFDRTGKRLSVLGEPGNLGRMAFSPDRKSVAVTAAETSGANTDIWIYDVLRGLRTRFTFDPAYEDMGVWSPDGRTILFRSDRTGTGDLYRKLADGSAGEELLYADNLAKVPTSVSPDGKYLAYFAYGDPKTGIDIWILPNPLGTIGALKPFPFVRTPSVERNPQFSPNGKWIAYQSSESGKDEIYVAPFPGPGGKKQVSATGGALPRWRADSKELFYVGFDDKLMAAEVSTKNEAFEVEGIQPLFGPLALADRYLYDVSADGRSFLAVVPSEGARSEPLTVVQNWTEGLKK